VTSLTRLPTQVGHFSRVPALLASLCIGFLADGLVGSPPDAACATQPLRNLPGSSRGGHGELPGKFGHATQPLRNLPGSSRGSDRELPGRLGHVTQPLRNLPGSSPGSDGEFPVTFSGHDSVGGCELFEHVLGRLAAFFVAGGGSVVIPQGSPLLRSASFCDQVRRQQ